jgi:hypothetical protein
MFAAAWSLAEQDVFWGANGPHRRRGECFRLPLRAGL